MLVATGSPTAVRTSIHQNQSFFHQPFCSTIQSSANSVNKTNRVNAAIDQVLLISTFPFIVKAKKSLYIFLMVDKRELIPPDKIPLSMLLMP